MKKHLIFLLAFIMLISINLNAQTKSAVNSVGRAEKEATVEPKAPKAISTSDQSVGKALEVVVPAREGRSGVSDLNTQSTTRNRAPIEGSVVAERPFQKVAIPYNGTDRSVNRTYSRGQLAFWDFEGGLPTGFTLTHDSGADWLVGANGNSSYFPIPAHTTYAYYNDDALTSSYISTNCRMILPVQNFTTALAPKIIFDQFYNNAYGDILAIQVSTNGGTTWTNIYTPTSGSNIGWETQEVSLGAYAGMNNVTICFYYDDASNWAYGWAVDNIELLDPTDVDLVVAAITPTTVISGTTVVPTVTINCPALPVAAGDWTVTLTDGGSYTSTKSGVAIDGGGSTTVNMDYWTPADGSYTLTATITCALDATPSNNTMSVSTTVQAMCEVIVYMHDSYGDGWNDGTLTFVQNSNVIGTPITLINGAEGTASIMLPSQTATDIVWTAGGYSSEVSFEIEYASGTPIFAHAAGSTYPSQTCTTFTTSLCTFDAVNLAVDAVTPTFTYPDIPVVPTVTVKNLGNLIGGTWTVTLTDGGSYTSTKTGVELLIQGSTTINMDSWTPTAGTYTLTATVTAAGDADLTNNVKTVTCLVLAAEAFTGNTTANTYTIVNLADGSDLSTLSTMESTIFPMAEEYDGTNVYRVYSNGAFGTANGGTFVSLGTISGIGQPLGLAYNHVSNTMYLTAAGSGNTILYTLDLTTLAATLVGTITVGTLIAMDFANDGFIYGPGLDDNLYKIDPTSGATTPIGPIGIDINYGQDVSYDMVEGKLYTFSCGAVYAYGFYDLNTGAFNSITPLSDGQHATFVITKIATLCDPIANLTSSLNGNNVTLTWTAVGSPVNFDILRNGVLLTTVTALTYTDNAVPVGNHTYTVKANYGATCTAVGVSTSVVIGEMCTITVDMHDSFGDGWNGGTLKVMQNGSQVGSATLSSGSEGTATINVFDALETQLVWQAGSWDGEITFEVYTATNTLIYAQTSAPSAGVLHTYSSACLTDVVNLTAMSITPTYVPAGTTATPTVTVKNNGIAVDATWTVTLTDGGSYTSTKNGSALAFLASTTINMDSWTPTNGNYELTATVTITGEHYPGDNTITSGVYVGNFIAYSGNSSTGIYSAVNLVDGSNLAIVGSIETGDFPMSEEYDGTYIYRVLSSGTLQTVDPTTGATTTLGTITGVAGSPLGLALNMTTGNMFLSISAAGNYTALYNLNVGTLAATLIGTSTQATRIIAMDFANDGFLYGPALDDDILYKIDPATGLMTAIGPLGFNLNYGQDVSYDIDEDRLYTYTCGGLYAYGYYDLTTGAFVQLSAGDGGQHATLVITKGNFCDPITNLNATVSGADNDNVVLTWAAAPGSPTGYKISRNGVVLVASQSALTYTDNALPIGNYSYTVTALYASSCVPSGVSVSVSIGQNCNITVNMHDSYGDGWNGGSLSVVQNGSVVGSATLSSGSEGTVDILVFHGLNTELIWSAGSYDSEVTFEVVDNYGALVYAQTGQPSAGTLYTYTALCSHDFTDLMVVNIAPAWITPGSSVVPTVTVKNNGWAVDANWTVSLTDGAGYNSTKNGVALAGIAQTDISMDSWTPAEGTHTLTATVTIAEDAYPLNNTMSVSVLVANIEAFTGNTTSGAYSSVAVSTGTILSTMGTIASSPFPMAEVYDGTNIYRVLETFGFGIVSAGTFTSLGTISGASGTPTGLAYNRATSTMYMTAIGTTTSLYTINLSTLQATLVGSGSVANMIIGIDFATDGFLYGPGLADDILYKIDPATGANTAIGALGININYGQDVSFDVVDERLYTFTCGDEYDYGYYDLSTGEFVYVAGGDGDQHATFVITRGAACDPVTNLNATTNEHSVTLTWTAPAGSPTGYEVKMDGSVVEPNCQNTTYTINEVPDGDHIFGVVALFEDCQGTAVFVSGHVGINNLNELSVKIYPNPTTGWVMIETEKTAEVSIFNVTGKLVSTHTVNNNGLNLNLSSGLYFVKVVSDEKTTIQKLIVE